VKKQSAIKLTLLLASMLSILANAIISPALPEINKAFSAVPNAEVLSKLLMTLPALTIALFASFMGSLIDKYGRKKILVVSLLIFALAGTSGLWLGSLIQILIGRFFLGFGVAGVMIATTTLIGDYYRNEERNQFISWQGAFSGFGGLLFITLAGYLTNISWRMPFAIYGFSLLIFLMAVRFIYEPQTQKNENDYIQTSTQAVDKKILYLIYFSAFIGIILFYILPLQIPFYLKTFANVDSQMAGWAIAALTTAQALASFFYRKLKSKFSYQSIYGISFIIMAVGYFSIYQSTSYWQIMVSLMLSGVGVAWLMPNSNLWLMAIIPDQWRGKYIGRLTTFIFLGQFISPFFVQPIQLWVGAKSTFLVFSLLMVLISGGYFVGGYFKKSLAVNI